MPYLFDDHDANIANIERWQERRRQVQAIADSVTPKQYANISKLAKMFPMVSPGVVRGLGQAGLGPDDDVTQFAITQELLRNYSTTGDWAGQLGKQQRVSKRANPRRPPPNGTQDLGASPGREITMQRAQDLLKTGETLGVFDPTTQVLVEPPFGSEDDPDTQSNKHKVFTQLQDTIFSISKSPVPYVARDGKIRSFSPDTAGIGDPEYALADRTNPGDISGISEVTGAYRNPSGVGGSIGQVESFGAQEQAQSAQSIISQIFANSEAHPNLPSKEKLRAANSADISAAGATTPNITPLVRGTFTAFEAPIQEIQGQVRNVYGALHGEDVDWLQSQSDLGIILPRVVRGQEVDTGSGFFVDPESAVARERRTREAERGQIGNHNLTVGRILANGVGFEPDTKAFQIVSGLADGVAQLADPTAWALGGVGKGQKAKLLFQPDDLYESAGAFKGIRQYFHGPTFDTFANKHTQLIDKLTELRDPYEIAKLTNFRLEPSLTANLAGASKGDDIRGILKGAIERGRIRTTTELTGTRKQQWSQMSRVLSPQSNPRTVRILKMMPGQTMDLDDPSQVARNLTRVLQNAHAREDDIKDIYNLVATAKTRNGLRDAVVDAQDRVGGLLDQYGIKDPTIRTFLTRINKSTYQEDLRGMVDEVGMDVPIWDSMAIDGTITQIPGSHLPLEHIGRYMHLPDQRAVRRLTSKYKFLTAAETDLPILTPLRIKMGKEVLHDPNKVGQARLPIAAMDFVMSEFLKPFWLMRLAWPIRVVGEEQFRMGADGLHSMGNHPISYVAMVLGGKESKLGRWGGKLDISPSGALFEDSEELAAITYRAHSQWMDQPGTIPTSLPTIYNKNNIHELADYRSSWARELALLHNDPVSNFIANNTLEDSIQWLYRGPGNKWRTELMEAHPGNLMSEKQVRVYVENITKDISRITSNHPDLIDIVKTGKYSKFKGGKEEISAIFIDKPRINPQFTHHLQGYEDVGPDKMRGYVTQQVKQQSEFLPRWNHAIDRFMSALMGQPTSKLSRSPAFRQYVWRRTSELIPYADDAARATILTSARKAGLNSRQMRTLERAAMRGKKSEDGVFIGKLSADDVDLLAKGYAIDDTKTLLYDLSERSQITDIMRNLIPFGEAWKEVITRWAKLATISGPGGIPLPGKAVRRAQQAIEGLRGSDLGNFMGAGVDPITGHDRGFFYTNEFGEEVFTYPGSEWLTSALTKAPIPLTGRVQGLNMFGTIVPGLGPAAQIPVAWFLQDKPELDWWRQQLLPFGGPGSDETDSIFQLRDYMPAWGKTAIDIITEGGYDDRIYTSSVMYTATYLHSTGEYGDTVEEQQRLLEDAKDSTRDLFAIRAFGQFILPSSPTFQWVTQDKSGRLLNTRILAEEFYTLQENDYDTAIEKFLDMYGSNAIGAITPHSRNVISAVPTSLEGAKWVSSHPGIKKKFDLVYGFFAPQGEFHMPTYARNYISGEREAITPKEWLQLRDTLLGNYHYNRAKEMLGEDAKSPNEQQSNWLRVQKAKVLESYPNWNNQVGLAGKPSLDQQVSQLYLAAKDRTLKSTDTGQALVAYLSLRDQAMAQAKSAGVVSFKTANSMAPTRQWLTDQAYKLIQTYPDFERLWDVVFSREMEDAVIEPTTGQ